MNFARCTLGLIATTVFVSLSPLAWAAPLAVTGKLLTLDKQPPLTTRWPQKFTLRDGVVAHYEFMVSQPGLLTAKASATGVPLRVWLDGPARDEAPASRDVYLEHKVTPQELARGQIWSVNIMLAKTLAKSEVVNGQVTVTVPVTLPSASSPPVSAPPPATNLSPPPPPPASGPLATAAADMSVPATANFDRIAGSVSSGGYQLFIGGYVDLDSASRYFISLQPAVSGHYRVRVTLSNIQAPTSLIMEAPGSSANCSLQARPGYFNYQICDLEVDAVAGQRMTVGLRKAVDAVAQITLLKADVTYEPTPGMPVASAQLPFYGAPQLGFDHLPGAMVSVAEHLVGGGGYVELNTNSVIGINLLTAPVGTYRFRAMLSNFPVATTFNIKGNNGQQWNCVLPASPGYQNIHPCDLVMTVPSPGSNLFVSLSMLPGGNSVATVNQILVFKEQ